MEEKYNLISLNKQYLLRSEYNPGIDNRAFRYGDGLFETMHANGLEIQFFVDHYARLIWGAEVLKLELPGYFSPEFLKDQISGLLSRCKLFQAARVRLSIFRKSEGLFIPKKNQVDVLIEATYLGKGPYELNEKGLVIGVFETIPKPYAPFFSFKSMNALPYIMAGVFANENHFDDALLISQEGYLIESTSSNIFAMKDKKLFTPSLQSGCVDGIMRKQIIRLATNKGLKVFDDGMLSIDDLSEMDELFLTNAISGIRWVAGFRDRRYYRRYSVKLINALNEEVIR